MFGFFQLDNEVVEKAEEMLEELKRNLTDKMLADLPLLHGGPLFMFQPLKLKFVLILGISKCGFFIIF